MITVLLADDQALVRSGFRMIVEAEPDLTVVGEAVDGDDVLAQCARLRPEVVLMDVRMPGTDGIEATRRIVAGSSDAPKVLVLTTFDLDDYVYEAMRAGASGFLVKDVRPRSWSTRSAPWPGATPCSRRRCCGGCSTASSPDVLLVRGLPRELARLTGRELEVLARVARGLTNAEIAGELFLGENTVKTHVTHILQKLDLRDRVQAVVLAYECGLVEPGGDADRAGNATGPRT